MGVKSLRGSITGNDPDSALSMHPARSMENVPHSRSPVQDIMCRDGALLL